MRRKYVLSGIALLLVGSMAAAWIVRSSKPQNASGQLVAKQGPAEVQPSLPLTQVVLFSSGVGYFQREGDVEGNTRIDLQFPIGDVNDLLKSLVLQDTGKGKIGAISYDGQDPVDKTLRSFSVNLTGNPTFGEVLNQARGEKVEVVMQQIAANQPGTLTGVIMGMESEMQPTGPNAAKEIHMLNLVCAEGVRAVNLREVQRIRFLNPRMEGELRKALDVLAASHDALKKQVSLNFKGDGKRRVKVGYVAENPIWKTSYRLSVDSEAGQGLKPKATLQGWAAVENVTDEDWNDVRVVLVAGRPISFQMDMYPPLFVPRAVVEPESFASLRPPSYGGALTRGKVEDMMANNATPMQPNVPNGVAAIGGFAGVAGIGGFGGLGGQGGFNGLPGQAQLGIGGGALGYHGITSNVGFMGGFQGQFGQQGGQLGNNFNRYQNPQLNPNARVPAYLQTPMGGGMAQEDAPGTNNSRLTYQQLQERRKQRQEQLQDAKATGEKIANLDPHGKLAAEAAAEELGSQVRYVIDEKISLPRQKSALLPLLDKPIEATRVCIYNESVHAKFPVLGLRVKNTSGQPLTQGPITVYEDGGYAGDARLPDLQPSEERLISYAIDLGAEVKTETRTSEGPAMTLTVIGDRLNVHHTVRETRKYIVRNRSKHDRLLVIEHPMRANWELAKDVQPAEKTRDMYRFDVPVAAGKDLEFEVAEEQERNDQFSVRQQTEKDGVRTVSYPTSIGIYAELSTRATDAALTRIRIEKGNVVTTSRLRVEQGYRVINVSEKEGREVTIRHRVVQDWHIVEAANPQAAPAKSKDFVLKLAPGKDGRANVTNEMDQVASVAVGSVTTEQLEKLIGHESASAEVKAALKKMRDQRAAIEEQRNQVAEVEKRLKEIAEEQDRLRKNLANLPPTSAAHKRYLEKFDKQETEIEGLQEQAKKLKESEKRKQKELNDLLPTLNAD